jgi:hypothetical protein
MDKIEVPKMADKNEIGWLMKLGMREIPKETIEDAKQLWGHEYARQVIRI